jgi:hypothetical protein
MGDKFTVMTPVFQLVEMPADLLYTTWIPYGDHRIGQFLRSEIEVVNGTAIIDD